jgi:hypothetical protein
MPARREASVPPHHTTMVEKIAIISHQMNSEIRSPEKDTPTAPDAYAVAAPSSAVFAVLNENSTPTNTMMVNTVANMRLTGDTSSGSIS